MEKFIMTLGVIAGIACYVVLSVGVLASIKRSLNERRGTAKIGSVVIASTAIALIWLFYQKMWLPLLVVCGIYMITSFFGFVSGTIMYLYEDYGYEDEYYEYDEEEEEDSLSKQTIAEKKVMEATGEIPKPNLKLVPKDKPKVPEKKVEEEKMWKLVP